MPKRVVFAEGEEEQVIRAAYSFVTQGLGSAILVGREDRVRAAAEQSGLDLAEKGIEIHNARLSHRNAHLRAVPLRAAAAARLSCSATASAWSTRTATLSPPRWSRAATPTRW